MFGGLACVSGLRGILKYYRNAGDGYGTVFMVAWSGLQYIGWWGYGGVKKSQKSVKTGGHSEPERQRFGIKTPCVDNRVTSRMVLGDKPLRNYLS